MVFALKSMKCLTWVTIHIINSAYFKNSKGFMGHLLMYFNRMLIFSFK